MAGFQAFKIWVIERRARSYRDPIERLRYLRQASALGGSRRSSQVRWGACFALAMATVTLRSDAINRESAPRPAGPPAINRAVVDTPSVWPVEHTSDYDLYSNGLRIENRLAVANEPRSYHLIERDSGALGPMRAQPAGIVFHTTESDQVPYEADRKTALQRIGKELLLYVRSKRAYHFVIDRFGRVHRIVVESDAANHAGHSIWADARWSYVDLNDSFLGVAFEASMLSGQATITEAQLRAARALTEMLRDKYNLAAEDCVVHAQVSVNPSNWKIGWHTDWGSGFPFREMGLPDNYQLPNPSIYLFGFEYDPAYTAATGPELWKGLAAAEEQVRAAAAGRALATAEYRKILRQRYRDDQSAIPHKDAGEENQHASN
jgi:hypothetical protein